MLSKVNWPNFVLIDFFCDSLYNELLRLSKTAKYQKVVKNKLFLMNVIYKKIKYVHFEHIFSRH